MTRSVARLDRETLYSM